MRLTYMLQRSGTSRSVQFNVGTLKRVLDDLGWTIEEELMAVQMIRVYKDFDTRQDAIDGRNELDRVTRCKVHPKMYKKMVVAK